MYYSIAGRSQTDKGMQLLPQQKMAAKYSEGNFTFPDNWAPYKKRKGDFMYEGGIPVPRGVSNNYFGDLKFYMEEYENSLK